MSLRLLQYKQNLEFFSCPWPERRLNNQVFSSLLFTMWAKNLSSVPRKPVLCNHLEKETKNENGKILFSVRWKIALSALSEKERYFWGSQKTRVAYRWFWCSEKVSSEKQDKPVHYLSVESPVLFPWKFRGRCCSHGQKLQLVQLLWSSGY